MSTMRRVHTKNFTVLGNDVLCDETLSAEALGVICYLIGRPNGWVLMPGHLASRFACGRDRMQRIIKELAEAGYIRKNRPRDPVTKAFLPAEYIILDSKTDPLPENTVAGASDEKAIDGEPLTGNPPLLNTEEQNTDSNKTPKRVRKAKAGKYSEEFETDIWQPYPRKEGTSKANAFKKWEALSPEDQQLVKASLPAYCLLKKGSDFVHHLEFYISKRIFETIGARNMTATGAALPIDRQTWENMAKIYANNSNWPRDFGPEPGHPGCRMPPDLQQQFASQH